MTPTTMRAILGLSAFLGALLDLTAATPQSKVWSLDFSKRVARNTPEINRLQRRQQKALNVGLENSEVEYVHAPPASP